MRLGTHSQEPAWGAPADPAPAGPCFTSALRLPASRPLLPAPRCQQPSHLLEVLLLDGQQEEAGPLVRLGAPRRHRRIPLGCGGQPHRVLKPRQRGQPPAAAPRGLLPGAAASLPRGHRCRPAPRGVWAPHPAQQLRNRRRAGLGGAGHACWVGAWLLCALPVPRCRRMAAAEAPAAPQCEGRAPCCSKGRALCGRSQPVCAC